MKKANKAQKMVGDVRKQFDKAMAKAQTAIDLFKEQVDDNKGRISFLNQEVKTLEGQNVKIEQEIQTTKQFKDNMDKFLNQKI